MNNEIYGPADRNALAMIITQLTEARLRLPVQLHRVVDTLIDVAKIDDGLSEADVRQALSLITRSQQPLDEPGAACRGCCGIGHKTDK